MELKTEFLHYCKWLKETHYTVLVWFSSVVLNLCYSDAFELQLPETLVRTAGGEGFWELQSKAPE